MPALTFIFAIAALVCIGAVVRLLARPTDDRQGRNWRVGLLLLAALVLLFLCGRNALIVQRRAEADRAVERGRELLQQGEIDAAEDEFERAAQLDPKNEDAKKALAEVEQARKEAEERAANGTGEATPGGGGAGGAGGATGSAAARGHPQRRESQVRITRYEVDVTLDLKNHALQAQATFGVRSKKGKRNDFEIALSPKCEIEEITVNGKPAQTKREDEWTTVTAQDRVTERRDAEVYVKYHGFGGEKVLPGGDVIGEEGSYLRLESRWCPATGYLEFRSPLTTRVTVPQGQYAIAPGKLTAVLDAPSGGKTYVWECRQNAIGATLAAGKWERLDGEAAGVPISVHLWKKHADRAKHVLQVAERAVREYTDLYGDFPYDKLAIAEVPFFPGGYSPTSMVFLGEVLFEEKGVIKKQFDAIIAHEIAHQWWGNLVMPQGPGAGWLAEGFAEYSSIMYIERAQGEQAFRRALWDAKQQYHFLSQNPPEEAIIDTDPFDQQGSYMGVVYSKGAYVLHMLRYVIGDEALFATLKGFLNEHRYGIATIADFTAEAEEQSGQDLDWFFDQWMERTGTVELVYDWSTQSLESGQWETIITLDQQSEQPYLMPIELQVVTRSDTVSDTGKLTGAHDQYRFVTREEPRDIDIDPHDNLLLAVPKRAQPGEPAPPSSGP